MSNLKAIFFVGFRIFFLFDAVVRFVWARLVTHNATEAAIYWVGTVVIGLIVWRDIDRLCEGDKGDER